MRYILTILLLVLIGLQTFSKWIIVLSYEISKDYIAKNLCVNRANPMSTCRGTCYLKKKIATDAEQQQPAGKAAYQKDIQLDILLDSISRNTLLSSLAGTIHNSRYVTGASQQFINSLFQPPQDI